MSAALTLYLFNALPLDGRAQALWEHGTFIVLHHHRRHWRGEEGEERVKMPNGTNSRLAVGK